MQYTSSKSNESWKVVGQKEPQYSNQQIHIPAQSGFVISFNTSVYF